MNIIQYNTIHIIQYIYIYTILYNTIQYNTIQYNTIQYNTIQYNTIQHILYYQAIVQIVKANKKKVIGIRKKKTIAVKTIKKNQNEDNQAKFDDCCTCYE